MKEQDEIENLFSSSFSDFEKMPPTDLKSAIDDQLFNGSTGNSKRRKGFYWIFPAVLIIGVLIFFGVSQSKMSNEKIMLGMKEEANNGKTDVASVEKDKLSDRTNEQKENDLVGENLVSGINEDSALLRSDTKEEITAKYSHSNQSSSKNNGNISVKKQGNKIVSSEKGKSPSMSDAKRLIKHVVEKIEPRKQELTVDKNKELTENDNGTDVIIEHSTNFSNSATDNSNTSPTIVLAESKDTTTKSNQNPFDIPILPPSTTPFSQVISPWTFSLYSGGTYGTNWLRNSTSENFKMKEQIGFSTSLEVNYALSSKFGLSSGLDVNARNEIFYKVVNSGDSILTGYTTEYVYNNPVSQDSIIDTLYTADYVVQTSQTNLEQKIQHTSVAVPITMSWSFFSKGNWTMGLNAGLRFSYVKNTLMSTNIALEDPQFKQFSMRANLRPQVVYNFNKFGIGGYLNTGFDVIPSVQWTSIHRNRIDYGAGIVLHYQL